MSSSAAVIMWLASVCAPDRLALAVEHVALYCEDHPRVAACVWANGTHSLKWACGAVETWRTFL